MAAENRLTKVFRRNTGSITQRLGRGPARLTPLVSRVETVYSIRFVSNRPCLSTTMFPSRLAALEANTSITRLLRLTGRSLVVGLQWWNLLTGRSRSLQVVLSRLPSLQLLLLARTVVGLISLSLRDTLV